MQNYVSSDEVVVVAVTHPTAPQPGEPVRVGSFCGVCVGPGAVGSPRPIRVRGVVKVAVKGVNASGNVNIMPGDKVYYVDADTPRLSAKNTGTFFGYALQTVLAGQTSTIDVLLSN